jgi:TATA-box binding protein (TBP) (component of TFIID and TFIIIB)
MNQSVKEFVRQSGVQVQSPNSNSNSNDEFAKELEMELERAERARRPSFLRTPPRPVRPVPRQVQVPTRLQQNLVNNRSYEGAFKQFENNSPLDNEFSDITPNLTENNMRALFEPNTSLQFSKFNPGMFNATVDSGFGQKETVVDLKKILMKKPLSKTPIGEGLYLDTLEIRGVYGQFKTGFSHTKEAGPKGALNKNFFSVQMMLTLSNDTESKGSTVNIYRNGKIRFSGGFVGTNIANQPELIRRFIVNNYTERQPFFYNPFTYNNLSGQFRINGQFKNMTEIARRQGVYGLTGASYEPELSPFLYMPIENMTLILSKSGNIQIVGAKNPADMLKGYDTAKDLVNKMYNDNQIQVTGVFDEGIKARARAKPKRKPKAKATNKTVPKRKYTKKTLSQNQSNAVMINPKMCARMKKPELVDLARRLGVVNFRTTTREGSRAATKDEICARIKNKTGKKNVTFKNVNKNVSLSGTGNTFRVGRKICGDLKKEELLRIAAILKIKLDAKETKTSLCKKIEKVRNNLGKPKPKSPPKPPAPTKMQVRKAAAANKRVVKKAEVMKKRGLDENSIRKDITKLYGDKWMKRYKPNLNQDVRNMKSALNAIVKGNKAGIPFKKNVDQVKKTLVSQWKMERKRELERKYLMNTVNVSGIAYNLRNDYRRAAANYIMNQKTAPSNKKMQEYRKYWLKFRANMNTNGNSRRSPLAARARVEKI